MDARLELVSDTGDGIDRVAGSDAPESLETAGAGSASAAGCRNDCGTADESAAELSDDRDEESVMLSLPGTGIPSVPSEGMPALAAGWLSCALS